MSSNLLKTVCCAALGLSLSAVAPSSAAAPMTTTQAMSSVRFLAGSWHCTGDGPPEDDVYTFSKNIWRDTDTLGGTTTGTFDAKRQKWVILFMTTSGEYGVNEASPISSDKMHVTVPYPPGMASHAFTFTKMSDKKFALGKQLCVKK